MEKVKGSPANKQANALGSGANTTEGHVLTWEVFVTPGIPIVTPDRPPGIKKTYFQAMARKKQDTVANIAGWLRRRAGVHGLL